LGYADDKNCLAELTVAQELNHGVRQWLYIIAGVLFFGSFFCTSKSKTIKTMHCPPLAGGSASILNIFQQGVDHVELAI
jgi:hypothetical protein